MIEDDVVIDELEIETELEADEILAEEQVLETRGRKNTCKYCQRKFKIFEHEKEDWKVKQYACPICGEKYCMLPDIDRELIYLQKDYVANKNTQTFNKLIERCYTYTEGLLKKHYTSVIQRFDGALEHYAHESVSRFIEYYLKDENFVIDFSFGGMLLPKIREAIFNKKDQLTKGISLDYEFDDGHIVEYEDVKKSDLTVIEEIEDKKYLCKHLTDIVVGIEEYCGCSRKENLIRLINTLSYLESGDKYFDQFFQAYGSSAKLETLKTLDIIRKELQSNMIYQKEEKRKDDCNFELVKQSINEQWKKWVGKTRYIYSKIVMKENWMSLFKSSVYDVHSKQYAESLVNNYFNY